MAIALAIGMTAMTTAQESESTEVTVDVDDTVQLDVKPDQLGYTNVGSGQDGALEPGEQVENSDRGLEHIDIENIGSDRLDGIYAESELHSEEPFGTVSGADQPTHNTGNLVLMSTETAQTDGYRVATEGGLADVQEPHSLNRIEFFEDQPPEYIQTESTSDETDFTVDVGVQSDTTITEGIDAVDVGRFRVGEANYFFVYVEDDTGDDDKYLLVGNTPETPTDLGTFDFRNENEGEYTVIGLDDSIGSTDFSGHQSAFSLASFDVSQYNSDEPVLDGNGGLVDFSTTTSLDATEVEEREYNLYSDRTDAENALVARTKFNVDLVTPNGEDHGGVTQDGAQEYILDASEEDEALQPGENFPVDIGVQLPNGIDNAQIEPGIVTFNAEAFVE